MRIAMTGRATAAAAVGTTLVLSLAGCLGESGDTGSTGNIRLSAAETIVKTSQKTAQVETFKADVTVTDSGDGGTKVHATGNFKLKPSLAFTAKLDQLSHGGRSVPGSGSQAILTGDVLYAKVPQLAQFVSGKPWVKVDLNQLSKQGGFDIVAELPEIAEQVDPAAQTKMFTGSKDVREVGQETVDGTKTTHYKGTVTVQDALNQLNPTTRAKVSKWIDASDSTAKLNFDLWVDKNQLPRKLSSTGVQGEKQTTTATVLYSDYGKSVTVNAPPSDQVGTINIPGMFGN